jgi:hypothetical protein
MSDGAGNLKNIFPARFFLRQFEDGLEKRHSGIADRELGGVDADSDSARSRRNVVTGESPLTALVQTPLGRQRQRMRRNNETCPEPRPDIHQNRPSLV